MRGPVGPIHTFICLLKSIKRPLNPTYSALVLANAGARQLSQRSINLHVVSVLLSSEWVIVARGIQFVERLCCLSGTVTGRMAASELDGVAATSEGRLRFIISFPRSGGRYLHRCSEDPLMCGVAEPLTAQWTDKCGDKAAGLVCVTLCCCPQWENNVRVRHWLPPSPPIFYSCWITLWKGDESRSVITSDALKTWFELFEDDLRPCCNVNK